MRHAHRSSTYDLCWQVWGYGLSQGAIASKSLLSPQASVRREALRFLRQRTGMVAGELLRRLRHGRLRSAVLLGIEIAGVLVGPLAYLLSRARTGHLRPDLAPASSPWPVESRVDAATPAMVAHEV
jgi:hypothetical protein